MDKMEKRIVYVSYVIIAFVLFNFFYGFTDWIKSWQVLDWYLIILMGTIMSLLVIKYKQNQRKLAVEQYAKENDRRRIQLNQLLMFEQLSKMNDEMFCELLKRCFELLGYSDIQVSHPSDRLGYDLTVWHQGKKMIVKIFKKVPMIENIYTNPEGLEFALGELVTLNEIREFYGSVKDYEVQADLSLVISTSDFEEEALLFAGRNGVETMNGYEFYQLLDELKDGKSTASFSTLFA